MSIRSRILLGYAAVAVATVLAIVLVTLGVVERYFIESLRADLAAESRMVARLVDELEGGVSGGAVAPGAAVSPRAASRADLHALARRTQRRITLIAADGTVLFDSQSQASSMENHRGRPEVRQALKSGTGSDVRVSRTIGVRFLYVAVSSKDPAGRLRVTRLAVPLTHVERSLATIRDTAATAAFAVLLIALAAGVILSRSLARPIQQITTAARRIADGDLSQRLAVHRRDEIGELSESLQQMADRLAAHLAQLTEEKQKLALMLDNMTNGVVLLDSDGNVVRVNPAAERMFRRSGEDLLGRPLTLTVVSSGMQAAIETALKDGKVGQADAEILTPSERAVQVTALPMCDGGTPTGVLVVLRDVTRQRRLEKTRKDFVANVSHELKTPVANLKLGAETLLRVLRDDPASAERFASSIEEEAGRLATLVGDLLELSRYESPDVASAIEPVRIDGIVAAVAETLAARAQKAGVRLTVMAGENIPPIDGDRDQLSSLAANLIDNALTYTREGGEVHVSTRAVAEEVESRTPAGAGGEIDLEVRDTGIGIPQEDQPRVFERFYRVDRARSRDAGGTGLGLSIVRHVADNHGAKVELQSKPGEGTTVTVRFPISAVPT